MSGLRKIDIVNIVPFWHNKVFFKTEWRALEFSVESEFTNTESEEGVKASMRPLSRLHPKAVSCWSCSRHTLERGWCASLTGSLISHIYSVHSYNGRMPVLFQPGTPPRSRWTRLMTDGWKFIYGPLCFIQAFINQPRGEVGYYPPITAGVWKSHIYPLNLSGTQRHSFQGVLCSN